jgi:hypothetical protein
MGRRRNYSSVNARFGSKGERHGLIYRRLLSPGMPTQFALKVASAATSWNSSERNCPSCAQISEYAHVMAPYAPGLATLGILNLKMAALEIVTDSGCAESCGNMLLLLVQWSGK